MNVGSQANRPWTVLAGVLLSASVIVGDLILDLLNPQTTLSWILLKLVLGSPGIAGTIGAFYGRNWGRILLLALTSIAVGISLFGVVEWLSIVGLFWGAAILAVVLLFMPTSNAWFRAKRPVWADA